MGSEGLNVKAELNTAIFNDPNIYSTMTYTPITRAKGTQGGYAQGTDTEGTARTINCIPSNNKKNITVFQDFGELDTGELKLLISADESVNKDAKITFQSRDYDIREIKPITFNEVDVAQSIVLAKRPDQ